MISRRARAEHAALLALFDPRTWTALAALIAIATTTHLTKPKGGNHA